MTSLRYRVIVWKTLIPLVGNVISTKVHLILSSSDIK